MAKRRASKQPLGPRSGQGSTWKGAPRIFRSFGGVVIVERMGVFIALYKGQEARATTPLLAVRLLRRAFPSKMRTVTEITAYRVFKLYGDCLTPVATRTRDLVFDGPVLTAHSLPTEENRDGLYSVNPTMKELQYLISSYAADVWAEVGLLGQVVIHELGHRAEKQVIRKLTLLVPSTEAFREILAGKYCCEVNDGWKQELTP